ncbi:auxin-induced protein [Tremella mesenterica]|uniref:Auxin-induced protein n=1 Tax=Tremella mesenterica TaxID=5217 RepID=A0A4Q1BKR9_TREME|nr:auxin-induced protein [Tremella mesenterica]
MSAKAVVTATIRGIQVPPMAIGTWSWGDTSTWGYKPEDNAGIKEAWEACNRVGLTFYDSAEGYGWGESERMIGRLLKDTDPEIRKKIYIATKYLPWPNHKNFFLWSPGVISACTKSRDRLGVEMIDLYQVHIPLSIHSFESIARELAQCVKMGLCRNVGVSNYSLQEVIRMSDALEKEGVSLASNQVEFSLLHQLPDTKGMLSELKKRDIAMLAYSPLAMGRLTGKYGPENPLPKGRAFGAGQTWEQLEPLFTEMKDLATKYSVSVSAIALNWVIRKGAIPLGGARNARQAEQNALAATFSLTDEEVASLASKGTEGK